MNSLKDKYPRLYDLITDKVFIGVTCFLLFIYAQNCMRQKSENQQGEAPKTPSYLQESCNQVAALFAPNSSLSTVQREEAWKKFKWKVFKWNLILQDVSSSSHGYTVQFKCENSNALIQDIVLDYPALAKNDLLKMGKGKVYQVEGILRNLNSLTGLYGQAIYRGNNHE